MNKIEVIGTMKDGEKDYKPGHLYLMEAPRKSGNIDTLMVLSKEKLLIPEGTVKLTGHMVADYIAGIGVPVYIVPESIVQVPSEVYSEGTATGTLKADPVCRKTKKEKSICTIIIITEDGPVPTLLWGDNASEAPGKYKAGDTLTVTGRLQSREFPGKKGGTRTTYELSARKAGFADEEV